jgi:hypothetical protein
MARALPACGYAKPSLELAVQRDRIAVRCTACGADASIARMMGLPSELVVAPTPRPSKVARALGAWRSAIPAAGTFVESYLQGRGIISTPPASIRFLPRQRNWSDGKTYSAMIALVQRVPGDGECVQSRALLIDAGIAAGLRHTAGDGFLALLLAADFDSAKTRPRFCRDCPLFAAKIVLTRRIVWFSNPDPDKERPKENHAWFIWQNPPPGSAPLILYAPRNTSSSTSETATAGRPSSTPAPMVPEKGLIMTKPPSTEKVVPLTVGNPASAAAFIIDQSHMEDFADPEAKSSVVECRRPPRGIFFTALPEEKGKPMVNRAYVFLLEIPGRDSYLVAPEIAKEKSDEDVIRPVLLARYVTMAGEEALWPLKLTPPDAKTNNWNLSALNILDLASSGTWVRIVSHQKQGHYRYQVSKKTFEEVPPRFTNRPFIELMDSHFKDRKVLTGDHEIWEVLANGSTK